MLSEVQGQAPLGAGVAADRTGYGATQGVAAGSQVWCGDHQLRSTPHGCRVTRVEPRLRPELRPRPRPLWTVPHPPQPFVGRAPEAQALLGAIGPSALLELVAPSGMGKSWLLRWLAQTPFASLPDGVIFPRVPLRGLPGEDVTRELFDCCFDRSSPSVPVASAQERARALDRDWTYVPTRAELRRGLSGLRAFVVLDDFELNTEDSRQVLDLLRACGVVYGRRTPGLSEARRFVLGGLTEEEFGLVAPQWLGRALTEAEWSALRALLRSSGGHPSAAVQAVSSWSVQPTQQPELEHQVLLTLAAVRGVTLDFESMLAVVFGAHVADASRAQLWRALESLYLRGSLQLHRQGTSASMQVDASVDRFALHPELCMAFDADPDLRGVVERVLAHFAGSTPECLQRDRAALLAALALAAFLGLNVPVVQCVRATAPHFITQGAWGSWQQVLALHDQAATALGDLVELGWGQHELGVHALCEGDPNSAAAFLGKALALRQRVGEPGALACTEQAGALLNSSPPSLSSASTAASRPRGQLGAGKLAAFSAAASITVLAGVALLLWPSARTRAPVVQASAPLTASNAASRASAHAATAEPADTSMMGSNAACPEGHWIQAPQDLQRAIQESGGDNPEGHQFQSVHWTISGQERGTVTLQLVETVNRPDVSGTLRGTGRLTFQLIRPGAWRVLSSSLSEVQCELRPSDSRCSDLTQSLKRAMAQGSSALMQFQCSEGSLTLNSVASGRTLTYRMTRAPTSDVRALPASTQGR